MNKFIRRAFNKIEKLSSKEFKTLVRFLGSENELMGFVLQKLEIGIVVTNDLGRVLNCNDAAKRLIPLERPMTEGTSLRYALADPDIANFMLKSLNTIE